MCLFKKKKKIKVVGNRFNLGDLVSFPRKDDFVIGYIYDIHQDSTGKITYDVQAGGECPAVFYDIPETALRGKNNDTRGIDKR